MMRIHTMTKLFEPKRFLLVNSYSHCVGMHKMYIKTYSPLAQSLSSKVLLSDQLTKIAGCCSSHECWRAKEGVCFGFGASTLSLPQQKFEIKNQISVWSSTSPVHPLHSFPTKKGRAFSKTASLWDANSQSRVRRESRLIYGENAT